MTCSSCGATIADKAIVCYRCGAPTAIPAQPPSGRSTGQKPPSGPLVPVVIGVILVVVAAVIVWFLTR